MGKFINTNWQLRNTVIIGNPDYLLGSLMYYVKNRIYYVPRESIWYLRTLCKGTEGVCYTARCVGDSGTDSEKEHVPVLILLKHFDIPKYFNDTKNDTYSTIGKYGWNFKTNREEVLEFSRRTIKMARI